jgi:hypothetical protein
MQEEEEKAGNDRKRSARETPWKISEPTGEATDVIGQVESVKQKEGGRLKRMERTAGMK